MKEKLYKATNTKQPLHFYWCVCGIQVSQVSHFTSSKAEISARHVEDFFGILSVMLLKLSVTKGLESTVCLVGLSLSGKHCCLQPIRRRKI